MAKKIVDNDEDGLFPKKWAKLLSSDWMTTAEGYSTDEIKKKIVQWEQAISTTEKDMEADLELKVIKDKVAELKEEQKEKSKVYTESIDISQAQIKFAVHLLNSRGVTV